MLKSTTIIKNISKIKQTQFFHDVIPIQNGFYQHNFVMLKYYTYLNTTCLFYNYKCHVNK